jgi:hypothetical protein
MLKMDLRCNFWTLFRTTYYIAQLPYSSLNGKRLIYAFEILPFVTSTNMIMSLAIVFTLCSQRLVNTLIMLEYQQDSLLNSQSHLVHSSKQPLQEGVVSIMYS